MQTTLENLSETERLALTLRMPANRVQAHQILFKHRHTDETPKFHEEMIRAWYSSSPQILMMAFREGGKSTIAEEAVALGACWRFFNNAIILGENEARAFDRLRAVKYELETNELIIGLYGEQKGEVWNEGRIELKNGVCIQAFGRGQAMRGTKHKQWRPDFLHADDIEEEEHVRDPAARHETLRWFFGKVVPALDRHYRLRVTATPLDPESMPMVLSRDPSWETHVYPIEHISPDGERIPTWESRYPLSWIDEKKASMERLGLATEYQREYMCVAEDPSTKTFTAEILKVRPRTRTWQGAYLFYDPARTTGKSSATTGWVSFSFIGNRIVVWDGGAEQWKPDELRDHIFARDDEYHPVEIGIEEDGLNEFLLQPLRVEMLRRNIILPLRPMKAPKGKFAFIEALQPMFKAEELTFAQELPVLRAQFLSYPTGRIDGPNALAYAPRMRPGELVYPGFTLEHVADDLEPRSRARFILAVNTNGTITVGVLVQVLDGGFGVFADYVSEGAPRTVLADLVAQAKVDIRQFRASSPSLLVFAPPRHFSDYDTIGLRAAARSVPVELSCGSDPKLGRDEIRALLSRRNAHGLPLIRVRAGDGGARWTLNGFSAGYAHDIDKSGTTKPEPRPGPYSLIFEGLECVAALIAGDRLSDDQRPNMQYTAGGQRYLSALPTRAPSGELKLQRRDD